MRNQIKSLTCLVLLVTLTFSTLALTLPIQPLAVSAQTSTAPPIWPTVQHDFQRTSVASSPGPTSNSTDWIFGPTGSIQSSPVIGSDGTIYFVDDNFHLFAVNPDGSVQWEQTFTGGLFSPAIGPSGTIYVPGVRQLYAFYPDGEPAWTIPYNISTDRNSALVISPQGILFEVDSNGTLFAINPFGTVASTIWSIDPSCLPATLALGPSGSLYCGTNSNVTGSGIASISPNGQLQWTYPTSSLVLVAPTIGSDGTLYVVSSGGQIIALEPNGAPIWTVNNIHAEVTSAVIGPDSTIYVAGDKLAAISESGTELWTEFCYLTSSGLCFPFGTITSMAVDSAGTLYVGTNTSGLVAINNMGGEVWAYTDLPPGEGSLSPIAIGSNGTMYVGTGCLYCSTTTYGHLLAIGQPQGYYSFTVSESGLPTGNAWSFLVNGENYSTSGSSLVFSLPNGTYGWTTPPSMVPDFVGERYAASVLQGNFSVPANNDTIQLSYSIEYQLNITAYPAEGGSVGPSSGNWYTPGTTVQLNASASSDYNFGVWSTNYGVLSTSAPSSADANISVDGPASIIGEFDPLVTLEAGVGGSVLYLDPPYVGTIQSGQSVSFYAPSESVIVLTSRPSSGYTFENWNADSALGIDSSSGALQFQISIPSTLTAEFSQTPTTSPSITMTSTQTTATTSVTSSAVTIQAVSVPKTSILPTRNVALDAVAAFLVALLVILAVIVIFGIGSTSKK